MSQEQTTIQGTDSGRALSDTLGDIISAAYREPGQAPPAAPPAQTTAAGTSSSEQTAPPQATATETIDPGSNTSTPPPEVTAAGTAPEKVKVKILPDAFYEVEENGQLRELDGKSLLGEMMLRREFNRKETDLKKAEEEAKAKLDDAQKIAHWVNLAAGDKFATAYLQALNTGQPPEKALTYASALTGLTPGQMPQQAPAEADDPRSTILDGIESDDPSFAEKTKLYADYKAEQAGKEAYSRIKAELSAERLQAEEKAKAQAAQAAEEQQRIDSIKAFNTASLESMDKHLEAKFGSAFSSLSNEQKGQLYHQVMTYLKDEEGIDLYSREYLTSNLVNERDIKYGVNFAFDPNFSLQPHAAQPPPLTITSGQTTPSAKMPFSAGGLSHGIPPVENRSEETPTETLHRDLNNIIAKAH